MLKVVKRGDTKFRIQIYDLQKQKSRTISVLNHAELDVDALKQIIIDCIERYEAKSEIGETKNQ